MVLGRCTQRRCELPLYELAGEFVVPKPCSTIPQLSEQVQGVYLKMVPQPRESSVQLVPPYEVAPYKLPSLPSVNPPFRLMAPSPGTPVKR